MSSVSRDAGQLYDAIGKTYAVGRRTEPRIAARVWQALGDAESILNVGAGTGSDEPTGRRVVAVEPSAVMRSNVPPAPPPASRAQLRPYHLPTTPSMQRSPS